MKYSKLAFVAAALLALACTPNDPVVSSQAAVIYGTDDRTDYYATSSAMQTRTENSIVAIIRATNIDTTDPMDVQLMGTRLQDSADLCADQRFLDDPAAADCSGTLIDDDLVLTAGHCFDDETACRNFRFVFDYLYESAGALRTVTTNDIYSCRRLVVRRLETTRTANLDYAIVQLDRPATGRTPAPVATADVAVGMGDPFTIIGFGSGIPAKIDEGGEVVNPRAAMGLDYFEGTPDAFGGNSGSGVFDSAGDVIGILVRGSRDYIPRGDCNIVNTLPMASTSGEGMQYVRRAIDELCTGGWPSATLCPVAAMCGDGTCSGTEDPTSCAADCTASSCGDGVCDFGEDAASCAADCTGAPPPTVPAGWTCAVGFYAALDGCDCDCGARDPDCDDSFQEVLGCADGELCGATGACEAGGTPVEWDCEGEFYDNADGCDCDCGAPDPDCSDGSAEVFGCAAGDVCGATGLCESGAPPSWTCDPTFFNAGDGCDCECGAHDPDCDATGGMGADGCDSAQFCSGGMCLNFPSDEGGPFPMDAGRDSGTDAGTGDGGDGCSAAPQRRTPAPSWLLLALAATLVWRRRA